MTALVTRSQWLYLWHQLRGHMPLQWYREPPIVDCSCGLSWRADT